tara:strand:+ start:1857 stop:2306 length:450 start_codon:yes stop_codon:yes gene_type:complete
MSDAFQIFRMNYYELISEYDRLRTVQNAYAEKAYKKEDELAEFARTHGIDLHPSDDDHVEMFIDYIGEEFPDDLNKLLSIINDINRAFASMRATADKMTELKPLVEELKKDNIPMQVMKMKQKKKFRSGGGSRRRRTTHNQQRKKLRKL